MALHATLGRMAGRSYVPHPRTMLFIEPVTFCNLRCSFCTYRMNLRPNSVMGLETFRNVLGQATALGFGDIALTPINGDVFMDKGILDKLRLIASTPDGPGIVLYTNLIAASKDAIAEILGMPRLSLLVISVYGQDFPSFQKITGRDETQFTRLIANLAHVEEVVRQGGCPKGLSICVRTARTWRPGNPAGEDRLSRALARLVDLGVPMAAHSTLDDWGGLITQSDVKGLDMILLKGSLLPKIGPCILPFFSIQVLADGRVNACACRDISGDLVIGDLGSQSLAEIISLSNPAYAGLIERQRHGDFPRSCRGCSFYRSIHDRRIAGASPKGTLTLEEFHQLAGGEAEV